MASRFLLTSTLALLGAGLANTLPVAHAAIGFTRTLTGDAVTDGGGSRSVNWIDIDSDGDLDLYVTNGGIPGENNFLYWNVAGVLTADTSSEIAQDGTRSVGSSWGDADNDGDLDLLVTSWYLEKNVLYFNDGDATFTKVTTSGPGTFGTFSESGSWEDIELDGDLDLFVANSGNNSSQLNFLFENDGAGDLQRVVGIPLVGPNRFSRHAAWCDADLDGDPDIYIANERGEDNQFYQNQKTETGTADFTSVTVGPFVEGEDESFGAAWGDIDNDGDFDLFVANYNEDNSLYRNQLVETGTFALVREDASVVSNDSGYSVSGVWGDLDNDGDLDLYVTNAFHPSSSTSLRNFVYENDGSGGFSKLTTGNLAEDEGWVYGAAFADFDADGDLDVFAAACQANDEDNRLYINSNDGADGSITVKCEGTASNQSGIGARVSVKATIDGLPVWQHRFVSSQESYCGQNLWQHFGLGDASIVDSLIVHWPLGQVQTLTEVPINQVLAVVEPSPADVGDEDGDLGESFNRLSFQASPNPFRESLRLSFRLKTSDSTRFVVRDVQGRVVHQSDWASQSAGEHSAVWNGSTSGSDSAPAGVYFLQLQSRAGIESHETRVVRVR